jgi:hypothetical protein
MNTLNNENIIFVPNTLDGENIVSSHLEENALLIDGTNQMLANLNAGNYRLTHVSNAISANDAVNKSQLDLKADTTYVDAELNLKADTSYVDGNFLDKTTSSSQLVAGRLSFNNATSGSSFPIIQITNAITGSNKGMYLQFFKNFNRLPNTEIGSIVFADKAVSSSATSRAVQLTGSIDSVSNPLFNITFDSGAYNPLTISNTTTILRTNDFYIKNKTTLENVFTYLNSTDIFTLSKVLDMNTTNKIINIAEPTNNQDVASKYYVDSHSANNNYLLRNGSLPMTGNLQMGSYKITNLLDPFDLNDGANKYYVDTQTANTHYLLRNGSLAMTGNLNLATHDLITTGTIDCNDITADGDITTTSNMSCADFTSNANQIIGGSSLNVLDVKSSSFFNADMLVNNNYHLAFYKSDLTTDSGVNMYFDRSVGSLGTFFMDLRGSEIRIRTAPSSAPTSERVKINNNETQINNNLKCNGSVTLGNNATNDTCLFNCQATFPDDSKLTFASGSNLEFNLLSFATFNTGSGLIINDSAINFNEGAVVNGSRVNLRSVSGNLTMSNSNTEGGILCTNTSTISITLPPKDAYWNNRSFFIKTQTGNVNIVMNTGTSIDNDNGTLSVTTDYISYHFGFDSDYENNGRIWKLATHG